MNLSELVFKTDTSELEKAQKTIASLAQDFSKLDKSAQQAAKTAAQTEKLLAQAAKEHAQARKANAEAADKEIKSIIAADKADESREKTIRKTTKAVDDQSSSMSRLDALMFKTTETTAGMSSGLSKGQSQLIAYAKQLGATNDQLTVLVNNVQTQAKLSGGNPFDKTNSGAVTLRNNLTELNASNRLYAAGLELTSKQARELARDHLRLLESAKANGQSIFSVREQLREQTKEYANLANQYNSIKSKEDALIKSRTDVVKATQYVTTEDKKMAAALNASNAALDKAGSDKLVKYEAALRQSGMSQDLMTKKLAAYKSQLEQVQAVEQKRAANNLSRAITPQLTDIAVSLYSGQAPLTVLLQQGGQLADIFRLSGVEAGNLGKLMKEAFYSMIPVIKEVGSSLLGLLGGVLLDVGRGAVKAVADVTGLTFAFETMKRAVVSGGEENFKYIGIINKMSTAISALSAGAIVGIIAALVTMGLEYKKIISAEKELSVALATSGGAMAMSKDQAVAYAEGMKSVGVGTLKAMDAITEFTKVGKIGAEGLDVMIAAALKFEKYTGVALSEVAKQYAELQDKPSESLVKIAEKTGLVDKATLDLVLSLEQQGDKSAAANAATLAYTQSLETAAAEAKANLSPIEKLWDDIKSAIGRVKQEIYDMTTSNELIGVMRKAWETVAVIISEVWFTIKGVGKEIGGIAAQIGAVMRGDFEGAKSIGDMMKTDAAAARAEQEKLVQSIMDRGVEEKKNFAANKENNSQYAGWLKDNEKALERQYSKAERFALKEKQLQKDRENGLIDEEKYNAAIAGWKRIIMGEKAPKPDRQGIKDLETEIDLRNKDLGLLSSFNNELDAIERRRKSSGNEDQYQASLRALIEKQPIYINHQKEMIKAQELNNKLMGVADLLGKDYYKTLEEIASFEKLGQAGGGYSTEQADKLRQIAFENTEQVKQEVKFRKESQAEAQKIILSSQKTKDEASLITEQMQQQVALIGLSTDKQKQLTLQNQTSLKVSEEKLRLERELASVDESVRTGKIDPLSGDAEKAKQALREASVAKITALEKAGVDELYAYFLTKTTETADAAASKLSALFSSSGQLSFANAVTSLNEMVKSFEQVIDRQQIFNELRKEAGDDVAKLKRINEAEAKSQLSSYANITNAAKGFFKEGSKGYKALNTAEKAFRAFEMAMALKNSVLKIALGAKEVAMSIAGQATMTEATVAGESVRTTAKVPGIFAAFMSMLGPWGIPAAIAAMAAVGIAASGGSKAPTVVTNQGTGTVFGDSTAKSESIKGSLDALQDVNVLTMHYSAEMAKSLRSIESSLTGVTNIILRSNGMEVTAAGVVPGTSVSGFGGALNSILDITGTDKILGKVINALFGTKTTITGQGVMVNDATYQQIQQGDINAGYYTDINRKRKFLGFTTSDKNSTEYKQDAELSDQFAKMLNGFVDTVKAAAPILGISLDQVDENLKDFVLKIGKIDLKDLKGDEIKEKLLAVFGAAGDDIARVAIKGFEKYQQVGEGYLETIVRLATTVESVRGMMDSLNYTFVLSIDNVMELVDAFGDLETLTKQLSDYNTEYYSEQERNATLQRQLTKAFKDNNLSLPKTREEFRKLVEAQDLTTEAGRKMYATLLGLAPSFDVLADAAEELQKTIDSTRQDLSDQLLEQEAAYLTAMGKTEEAAKKRRQLLDLQRDRENTRLMALDPKLAELAYQIWLLEDATNAAIQAETDRQAQITARNNQAQKLYDQLQAAVNAEKEVLNTQKAALEATISTLTAIFDTLKNNVKELYLQVDSTSAMQVSAARGVISTAVSSGILPDNAVLTDAIATVRDELNANNYATKVEADRARLQFAAQLDLLKNSTEEQLTDAERQLKAVNKQIDYLEAILASSKKLLDAFLGNDATLKTVANALADLTSFLSSSASGSTGGSGTGTGNSGGASWGGGSGAATGNAAANAKYKQVTSLGTSIVYQPITDASWIAKLDQLYPVYHSYDGTGNLVGLLTAFQAAGGSMADLSALSGLFVSDWQAAGAAVGIPAFAKGGSYGGGVAMVGEQGPELINFRNPGQVYTAGQTSNILSGSDSRVEALERNQAAMQVTLKSIADNTKRTADVLRNISPAGDSIQVESESFLEL